MSSFDLDDWVFIDKDEVHVKRERKKARELKNSQWWKNLLNKGICHFCHKKFPAKELTMDHLVPVSRGGKSNKGNIVVCCKECNNLKKYYTPAEMLMRQLEKEEEERNSNN